ncbi:MAG: hypothetical protein KDD70_00360 [Bdellovibrionales bacterium]|nr:hypothetical protein [Bdellovibrionales bacterium]
MLRSLSAFLLLLSLMPMPLQADSDGVRVLENRIFDEGEGSLGGSGTFSIDTREDNCELNPDADPDPEPFFDTLLQIRLINNRNQDIRFTRLNYRIRYRDEFGNRVRVKVRKLGVSRGAIVPGNGEEGEVLFLLLDKKEDQKGFPRSSTVLPTEAGFRKIRYTLFGNTESGERITLRSVLSVSIDNFNRC